MTDAEFAQVAAYVDRMRRDMGLWQWTVVVERSTAEDSNWAEIHPTEQRYYARLRVGADFVTARTPDEQRLEIVHELLHLHFSQASDTVRVDLAPALGELAHGTFWRTYKRLIEYGVDQLAEAIAGRFPLMNDDSGAADATNET